MIRTLIEIGKSLRDEYPMPLAGIPYKNYTEKNPPRVLVVDLTSDNNGNLRFKDAFRSNYSPEVAKKKYYFRDAKPQGAAHSLSFKLPPKSRTLRQRLEVLTNLGYYADKEEIARAIEEKAAQLKEKGIIGKSVLIVLRIDGKWPAENERLKKYFMTDFLDRLGENKFRKFWKVQGICHGCGEQKLVYGGVGDLLKFYTVNKYGYAPELNPKIAWKQYALCEDCIFDLERAKRTTEDYLTFKFYDKPFWLLPVTTKKDLRQTLNRLSDLQDETRGKIKKEFEFFEDRLLYEASIQKEVISYHFVFLKQERQKLWILLHIEEVLPSILGQYVNRKQRVEKHFNETLKDAIPFGSRVHFKFFSSSYLKGTKQIPGFSDKDFFNLVDRVFRQAPISENYLISKSMARIQTEMAQNGEQARVPKNAVLETLLSLEFLLYWGILKRKIGGVTVSRLPYDEFFEEHGDFFNHPAKRGLVLLGVLVQKFLNYQFKERKSTPFMRTLKNLRLDQKDIQRVFTSLQNKMNEYGIGHYWADLRQGVSIHFIEAGDKWLLSPDEIGFYVAVGMTIHSLPIFGKFESEKIEGPDE